MEATGPGLVGLLAQHGLPGIIIGLLVFWVYLKDKELKSERDARIADAKAFTELALKLQETAIVSVNRLADVFDQMTKLQAERDANRQAGSGQRRGL